MLGFRPLEFHASSGLRVVSYSLSFRITQIVVKNRHV
jgi:hypothetical protein